MRGHVFWVSVCALALLVPSQASSAAEVTHFFTGVVTSVDPLVASEFSVGDIISGSYTFDDLAVDLFPDADYGGYEDHYTGVAANFTSGYSVSINPLETGDATLIDDGPITGDLFDVFVGVNGLPVNGLLPDFLNIGMYDVDGVMLWSDDLLAIPPDISLAETANGYLRFDFSSYVWFDLISLTAVPEPSTMVLGLTLAILGLTGRLRKKC